MQSALDMFMSMRYTNLRFIIITLIVCAPYLVNLNNNTFKLKTLLFFVHLRTQQKRTEKKSSPIIKFTVLTFRHFYFESNNHK